MSLTNSGAEFLRRKWRHFAWVLDHDKDGLVSRKDHQEMGARAVEVGGLDPNSKQACQIQRKLLQVFDNLYGKLNNGNAVSYDQVVGAYEANLEEVKRSAIQSYQLFFDIIDFNADGVIQKEEFRKFFHMCYLNVDDADAVFESIDLNGDGKLDMDEFMRFGDGFFFCTDETHPSKNFFGILP